MAKAKVTMLNSMAGEDFEEALDRHLDWGLSVLDLKDAIFGKRVVDLTPEEAQRAAELISERGLSVHCFSTSLFNEDVGAGEAEFRRNHLGKLAHVARIAKILRPHMIRLHPPQSSIRHADNVAFILKEYPWLISLYAEAVDYIHDAGFKATIENDEIGNSVFSHPKEVVNFFSALDRGRKVGFTWDVQNMWAMGTFPSLDVYSELKPLISYLHLKGGQSDDKSANLRWQSSLEDASWSVVEITRQAVKDNVSPVICLNLPHGSLKKGYDYKNMVKRDLDYIREQIPQVE